MGRYVHFVVQWHPRLEPLRQAGENMVVTAHAKAIGVATRGSGRCRYDLVEEIRRPEWWLPQQRSHGDALADELADVVRQRWESWRLR